MKADKTKYLIGMMYNIIVASEQFSHLTLKNLDDDNRLVREELEQLELKSDELDRREQGAKVKVHGIPPTRVCTCGNCDSTVGGILKIKYYKYCSHCGYRLIHPEPETYTVQINGKDVVLQKGVDYEVIPKKEIFYL